MDLQALYALILSIIAGMATLIGAIIVIIIKKENKNKKMFHVKHRKDGEIWLALEDQ